MAAFWSPANSPFVTGYSIGLKCRGSHGLTRENPGMSSERIALSWGATAKRVALATNGTVSTDHAGNEVIPMHLNVEQLTAKNPHPLLNTTRSMAVHVPAHLSINARAASVVHSAPCAAGAARPGRATGS